MLLRLHARVKPHSLSTVVLRNIATGFIIGYSGTRTVSLGARPPEGRPGHVTDSSAKDYR